MLCSVSLQPRSLRFRNKILRKVIVEKASDKRALNLVPLKCSKIIAFPSTTALYCVVLRHCSIFSTLPALWAKDRRKKTCTSEMFAKKLGTLTKIILKTLCSVRQFCWQFQNTVHHFLFPLFLVYFWVAFAAQFIEPLKAVKALHRGWYTWKVDAIIAFVVKA